MILELELLAMVALQAAAVVKRTAKPAPPRETSERPAYADILSKHDAHVEIVKRAGPLWVSVGHRHADHTDIAEALRTPGLAVRHADGSIEEGSYGG